MRQGNALFVLFRSIWMEPTGWWSPHFDGRSFLLPTVVRLRTTRKDGPLSWIPVCERVFTRSTVLIHVAWNNFAFLIDNNLQHYSNLFYHSDHTSIICLSAMVSLLFASSHLFTFTIKSMRAHSEYQATKNNKQIRNNNIKNDRMIQHVLCCIRIHIRF